MLKIGDFEEEKGYIDDAIMKMQAKKRGGDSGIIPHCCPDGGPNHEEQARARFVVKPVVELAISHWVHLNVKKQNQEYCIERDSEVVRVRFVTHGFLFLSVLRVLQAFPMLILMAFGESLCGFLQAKNQESETRS